MKGRSSGGCCAKYVSYLNVRGSVVGKFETLCRWQCSWACRTPEGSIGDADGGTVQWVILCFWLLELLLAKNADYPDLKGNIQSFLLGHINMLHIRTAFQLVSSHNRDGAASIAGAGKENAILHLDKHSIDSGVVNFIFRKDKSCVGWRTIYDSFNLQVEDVVKLQFLCLTVQ